MASQTDAESNQMTPRQTVTLGFGKENHKSCDACRIRKVRCPGPAKPDFGPCATCVRRNKPCHFSSKKLARRKNAGFLLRRFGVKDSLFRSKTSPSEAEDETPPFIRGNSIFAGDLSLTFFSETRLQSLASCLRNNKVNELPLLRIYFECVHPLYPFLDREAFERTFANPDFFEIVNQSRAWSCLYHSVLAMGCQCDGGGSFEPGVGDAWNLFFVALSLLPDLMLQPDSLLVLQAMAAMAIQCSGISCVMMEHVITSEAARRAQNLSTSNFSGPRAKAYQRTFWCLYAIEKTSSFYFGRSSAFIDGDISCPIPHVPESVFGDFDWFLSIIRHARIISQTYSSLFSVAVANKPNAYYMDIIDQLNQKHDDWRMSIPDTGFRPGGLKPPSSIHCGVEREAAVMIHYYHDGLQLTLARATLHRLSRLSRADDPLIAAQQKATMEAVLSASRSVLERTVLVNVDPHTSIWILAGIPIIGLFVVFDFVIHSPLHVNTPSHLALLDMAGGHFSRIEYRSQGYLPGSLISEFAHIAREYVNDAHQKQEARATQAQTLPEIVNVPQPQQGAAQVQAMANAPKVGPKEGIPSDMDNVASAELPDFSMAFNGFPDYTPSNATMGTDVMGIFNYYLPELDPMFSQGLDEEYAFSQELSTGIPMTESMDTTRM
ncbi:ABC-transporter-regulating transcription factor like protein [Verticillium longisporum]|uniref:ABC-transporter-regulating transcription factor like protein n=1 Tax=Verticillium longisporum TaxID=100787 RepID=A0A8I3ANP9_VERLO|nr:ABC-transporter-regulating transcription factor like protein [Verticillium longisporum]